MRGEILSYDDVSGTGLISGDDSIRYGFTRADVQAAEPSPSALASTSCRKAWRRPRS